MARNDSLDVFDKIERNLYLSKEETKNILTPWEMEVKERWMLSVTKLMDDPSMQDKDLVKFIMNGCGGAVGTISQSQAYRDVTAIYRLVGKINLCSKEWYRYMVIEMCKKAYAKAEASDDAKGMSMAADKIGKYTRCGEIDDEGIDFDKMIPPVFEPSDDVTLLGIKQRPDMEERRDKLRSMLKSSYTQDIVDVKEETNE